MEKIVSFYFNPSPPDLDMLDTEIILNLPIKKGAHMDELLFMQMISY